MLLVRGKIEKSIHNRNEDIQLFPKVEDVLHDMFLPPDGMALGSANDQIDKCGPVAEGGY
jgi:hypothetical protein